MTPGSNSCGRWLASNAFVVMSERTSKMFRTQGGPPCERWDGRRLTVAGAAASRIDVREEFLETLARQNPTKFRLFLDVLLVKFQEMCVGHVQELERKGILSKGK
jgi:hypothetical protein